MLEVLGLPMTLFAKHFQPAYLAALNKPKNVIPIPLGKAGRPPDLHLKDRIGISMKSGRITIPARLHQLFNKYNYIAYYFSNYDLVIKFMPIKQGDNSATAVRIFKGGRVEFKLGKNLTNLVNTGRYLYTVDGDQVIIEEAINKDLYNKLIKDQTENYKL